MTIRGITWVVLLSLAGVLSAGVTVHGAYSLWSIDLRQDSLLSGLFCALALLCFPVFVLVRPPNRAAFFLSLMALTYLGAYATLNWRTCSELGYCQGVTATVLLTLSTNVVLAYFAVVILSLIALLVNDQSALWRPGN